MKSPVTALLLLACLMSAAGQDTFMVMSIKGKVETAPSKAGKWKKVEVGQTLTEKDFIRTSFASYVKLMHNAQRLVSIDQNTTKNLGELRANLQRFESGGATERILQYAASQLQRTKSKESGSELGAVRASTVFNAAFPKYDVLYVTPRFEWVDSDSTGVYDFLLIDGGFNTVENKRLTAQSHQLAAPALEFGRTYYWRVTRVKDGLVSDMQTFRVLSEDSAKIIQDELARLDSELDRMGADAVTKHLIRAIYYERKQLFTNAFHEYRATMLLAPGTAEYRDLASRLLTELRLYNEERFLLQ